MNNSNGKSLSRYIALGAASNQENTPKSSGDDNAFAVRLKGYSGCSVVLTGSPERPFVRKISPNRTYNARLREQIRRQQEMQSVVKTASVISTGFVEELFYADMEYIAGVDFQTLAETVPIASLLQSFQPIFEFIYAANSKIGSPIEPLHFRQKVAQIQEQCNVTAARYRSMTSIFRFLDTCDWTGVPHTPSHGDLTLENIIFDKSRCPVLIDFGDGPFSSSWLDAAKLLQDCRSGWSTRRMNAKSIVVSMAQQMIGDYLDEFLCREYTGCVPLLRQLRVFQFARVLPYIRSQQDLETVVGGLQACIQED